MVSVFTVNLLFVIYYTKILYREETFTSNWRNLKLLLKNYGTHGYSYRKVKEDFLKYNWVEG